MDSHEVQLETSPEEKANPISRMFLLWLLPLLRKGARKDLELGDVYRNLPNDGSAENGTKIEEKWNKEVSKQRSKGKQPRLWRAVSSLVSTEYALCGLAFSFDELGLRTTQPIILRNFISTFREEYEDDNKRRTQYLYALALVAVTLGHSLVFQKMVEIVVRMGIKLRLGLSSVIYRKILKLRKSDTEQANVGKLVNLLSSDVSRLDQAFVWLHFFYIAPIQLTIFAILLWNELGVSSIGGVGCILIILPVQILLGRFSMYFRTRIARRTDERGRFLNEIIGGIRLIKMYTWENPFAAVVAKLRRAEIKFIRRHLYLKGIYVSVHSIAAKMIPFCALIIYVLLGNTLTAEKAFFSITVFNTILQAVMNRVPNAASQFGELIASLNRIESFLLSADNTSTGSGKHFKDNIAASQQIVAGTKQTFSDKDKDMEPGVIMENYSASWTESQKTMKNLTMNLNGNKLVMVVGKVGSGKSSFLNAILSELPFSTGHCLVNGRLSYASQEAWIFPATLRQNILFGLPMEPERYSDVIRLCCLTDDLKQFSDGDLTLVGERGVALSGGQKARVNLARAVYQSADIYLLDDPLSAVDTKVSKSLFHDCFKQYLTGKLRILVTHQLQYLPYADHIIVLNQDGGVWCEGTYEQLKTNQIDFTTLIDGGYFQDEDQAKEDDKEANDSETISRRSSSASTSSQKDEASTLLQKTNDFLNQQPPNLRKQEEQKKVGAVGLGVYIRYFRAGGSFLRIAILVVTFLLSQFLFNFVDYWLSLWTNSISESSKNATARSNSQLVNESDEELPTMETFASSNNDNEKDTNFYTYVYCGLMACFIVVATVRSVVFFWYCMRISINLHDSMFASMVRAPVKFFDDNPSGRIMNRFAKDLNHIDENLPIAFNDFASILLALFGMLAINIATNYYIAVPAAIFLVALWRLRKFFLASARDLKRIESLTKSPMFTHVTMTVQGMVTIRALKAENRVVNQFDNIQDTHTSVFYLMFISNRWFALWLEIMSAAFLTVVCLGFLIISTSQGGSVGVAISTILSLAGALQWGIRQSAETENYMTSVERVFEYSNLTPEAPLENPDDTKYKQDWPTEGRVQFDNVSLAYDEQNENQVLKKISFQTESQEKVGIVGRTGAGKSSLITALFRMTEPGGAIRIDGVPIKDLGLHTLRSKISIIPQDPVLFTGSVRYNLDPFSEFSDDQLWHALQEVELHQAVQSLDFQVADGGSNFSTGQRQLVCFARAILRKNKILVLDEATANVDPATDHLVQHKIRAKFSDCTILTIAHRLQSVLDCDRILVLDVGKVVEFDSPSKLLENEGTLFSTMLKYSNSTTAPSA